MATPEKADRRLVHRIAQNAFRLLAVGLVAWVVWQAGWDDRVETPDGRKHHGRVVAIEGDTVRLDTSSGEVSLVVDDPQAVRYGLRQPLATLARRPGLFAAGALLQLAGLVVTIFRWGGLLAGAGLAVRRGILVRLGFLGNFFAAVLPGGAGAGDLAKAIYVARHRASTVARSVLTVVVDRSVGIAVMSLVAVTAALGAPSGSRLASARPVLLGCVALGAVACALLLSPRLRGRLRIDRLIARLPFRGVVQDLAAAVGLYAARPRVIATAAGVSLASQALTLAGLALYGAALGDPLSVSAVLVAIPVAMLLSAIPGLPGGWGVGDAAFFYFLPAAGVAPAQALALSFCFRGMQTLFSLPGGLWITGFRH